MHLKLQNLYKNKRITTPDTAVSVAAVGQPKFVHFLIRCSNVTINH
ncbi:MAG: hypothetical protein KC421_04090 [Anaerolineales bacterium]|nr:hypothetical protein [Anaerolineales bacterium]